MKAHIAKTKARKGGACVVWMRGCVENTGIVVVMRVVCLGVV